MIRSIVITTIFWFVAYQAHTQTVTSNRLLNFEIDVCNSIAYNPFEKWSFYLCASDGTVYNSQRDWKNQRQFYVPTGSYQIYSSHPYPNILYPDSLLIGMEKLDTFQICIDQFISVLDSRDEPTITDYFTETDTFTLTRYTGACMGYSTNDTIQIFHSGDTLSGLVKHWVNTYPVRRQYVATLNQHEADLTLFAKLEQQCWRIKNIGMCTAGPYIYIFNTADKQRHYVDQMCTLTVYEEFYEKIGDKLVPLMY